MNRIFTLILFFFSFSLICLSQDQFQRTYGQDAFYWPYMKAVQQTMDGGYIMAGLTSYGWSDDDVYIIKTNSAGDTSWTKVYGTLDDEIAEAILQTSDGGYVITGTVEHPQTIDDVLILRLDNAGELLWANRYGGMGYDNGLDILESADGGFVVAGRTDSYGAGNRDVYLLKVNVNGDIVWSRTYGTSASESGHGFTAALDGGYTIAGFGNNNSLFVQHVDSVGTLVWSMRYFMNTDLYGNAILQDTITGDYLITGYVYQFQNTAMLAMRITSTGDTVWTKKFGGIREESGFAINKLSDGNYVLAGYSSSFLPGNFDNDGYVVKIDGNGTDLWAQTYGSGLNDYIYGMAATSDGGFVMTGGYDHAPSLNYECYLVKAGNDGNSTCHMYEASAQAVNLSPSQVLEGVEGTGAIKYPIALGTKHPNIKVRKLCGQAPAIEEINKNGFQLYPNPTTGQLTVAGATGNIEVLDIFGRMALTTTQPEIDLSHQPRGIYFIKAGNAVRKLVVR